MTGAETDLPGWDWNNLAFASKKPLDTLHATFITAPRELSARRFAQLVKTYLPQGNIVLGLAKEPFVDGFAGQAQFRMLQLDTVRDVIAKTNRAKLPYKIYTLRFFQRETDYILQKITFRAAVLVNGSWQRAFHTRPEYYTLINRHIPFELVSPFADEAEARATAMRHAPAIAAATAVAPGRYDAAAMMAHARQAAAASYDYIFQTGAALGKPIAPRSTTYQLLAAACNQVVPYPTYALHHGSERERHFSPPGDLNHYDAVHAEVALLLQAARQGISLENTTLFINLLPCPTCARMLCASPVNEVVYALDHSDGYAIKLLTPAGKKIRRLAI